jgi:hypothetical protein
MIHYYVYINIGMFTYTWAYKLNWEIQLIINEYRRLWKSSPVSGKPLLGNVRVLMITNQML